MLKKHLTIINIITFGLFSVYFFLYTTECEVYFMRDSSVNISPKALTLTSAVLFLGLALIDLLQKFTSRPINPTVLLTQYFLSLVSMGLLTISINKPCEFINGGHYMMTDPFAVGVSFLLKLICYLLLGLTFIWTFINLIVSKKNKQ